MKSVIYCALITIFSKNLVECVSNGFKCSEQLASPIIINSYDITLGDLCADLTLDIG